MNIPQSQSNENSESIVLFDNESENNNFLDKSPAGRLLIDEIKSFGGLAAKKLLFSPNTKDNKGTPSLTFYSNKFIYFP